MEIKIINSPYYMDNGCSCCEGWWYDYYTIEVDGEKVMDLQCTWRGDQEVCFPFIKDAEEYVKKHFPNQPYRVVDDGYPDEEDEGWE